MSAYIVGEGTMDRAIHGLVVAYAYQGKGTDTLCSIESRTAIGRALYAMNYEAVKQRYGDTEGFRQNLDKTYCYQCPPGRALGLHSLHKAMSCLIYQCMEGYVPDSPLYQRLHQMADVFLEYCTKELRVDKERFLKSHQYNKADWDSERDDPKDR